MPAKTSLVTEELIRKVPLPQHGKSYTVIPHGHIIDQTRARLAKAGLHVTRELYRASADGEMAKGIYHLNDKDSEMSMMFAWSNSYNKKMRFKCAIGARVIVCDNGMVSGDLASFNRKHTGSALTDVDYTIDFQISHADQYFKNLVTDREMLKNVVLSKSDQGAVVGQLFASMDILTLTQLGIVKREMDKPSHKYNSDENSAWSLYNHITMALKESHPLNYLKDHQDVHNYFVDQFGQLHMYEINETDADPDMKAKEEAPVEEEELTIESIVERSFAHAN